MKLEKLTSEQSSIIALQAAVLKDLTDAAQAVKAPDHIRRVLSSSEVARDATLRLGASSIRSSLDSEDGSARSLSLQADNVTLEAAQVHVLGTLSAAGSLGAASIATQGSVAASGMVSAGTFVVPPSAANSAGLLDPNPVERTFDDGTNSLHRATVALRAGVKHWMNLAFRTTVHGYCDLKLMSTRLAREFQFGGASLSFYMYSETDGDFRRLLRSPVILASSGSHSWTLNESEISAVKGNVWNATESVADRRFTWWILRFPIETSRLMSFQTLHASLQCVNLNRADGSVQLGNAPFSVIQDGLTLSLDATTDAGGLAAGGSTWQDASTLGPRHDGQLRGGATYATMPYPRTDAAATPRGVALSIGYVSLGENDDVAFIGQVVDPAGPFTVSIWMRRTGDSSGSQTHVLGNGQGTSQYGFRCALREANDYRPALSGWKGTAGDVNFDVEASAGPGVGLNVWRQLTYQWDGTTASGGVKVFTDGVLQASGTAKATLVTGTSASESLNLGSTENGRGFVGDVGTVHAYSRVLSPTEVANNFDATRTQYGR